MDIMLLLLLTLGLSHFFHPHVSYGPMVDKAQQSVVYIQNTEGRCSGFMIAPHRVMTAKHCVGEALTVDNKPATVLRMSEELDLALLEAEVKRPLLTFRDAPIHRWEHLTAIGHAFGWPRDADITALQVIVIFTSQPIEPDSANGMIVQGQFIGGMSGGPIVDQDGKVVSIVQRGGEGLGYGVVTLQMRAFLLGA
jgi:S1-C subfamily serine protease